MPAAVEGLGSETQGEGSAGVTQAVIPMPHPPPTSIIFQLTPYAEAHRGCLSTQTVLSLADVFSLVLQLHPRQLKFITLREQDQALPAQHGRGVAVGHTDQAQGLTLLDLQRCSALQDFSF